MGLMGFRVEGLGFRVQGFRLQGLGFRGSGFRDGEGWLTYPLSP